MTYETDRPDTWPPELDALAAAPEHHALRLENEHVRVLDTVIPAGQTTALHTHCWPAVYLIESWSPMVRRDAEGNVTMDSRTATAPAPTPPYAPIWAQPIGPHTLENVGDREIRLVSVEIKSGEAPAR